MRFSIITIFPKIFDGFLNESLLARAQKKKIINIQIHNLRKWTTDRHQTVDDKPYGGGVGMVLKIEPIYKAVLFLKSKIKNPAKGEARQRRQKLKLTTRTILFSPRGKTFDQKTAKRLAKYDQLTLICGRYEGVDERVADHIADEVISVGDYVLNGGEVAAMAVIETISRMIPGFIAKKESADKPDHPQYTRPEEFKLQTSNLKMKNKKSKKQIWKVPPVLLSGNHKQIAKWREKHMKIDKNRNP